MALDFGSAIDFVFKKWITDKDTKKILVLFLIALLVLGGLSLTITALFGAPLYNPEFTNNPNATNMTSFFFAWAITFFVGGFISILIFIATYTANYKIIARALSLRKKQTVELTPMRFLRYAIALPILNAIISMLCLYNLKFLAIPVVAVIMIIISAILLGVGAATSGSILAIVGGIGLFIGILLFLAYFVVIIYNQIRLITAEAIFIEKEQSITVALKKSWDLTEGNASSIFLTSLGIGIITFFISMIFAGPQFIYAFGSAFMTAFTNPTATSTIESSLISDPIYLILSLFALISTVVSILVNSFLVVFIYTELNKKK